MDEDDEGITISEIKTTVVWLAVDPSASSMIIDHATSLPAKIEDVDLSSHDTIKDVQERIAKRLAMEIERLMIFGEG